MGTANEFLPDALPRFSFQSLTFGRSRTTVRQTSYLASIRIALRQRVRIALACPIAWCNSWFMNDLSSHPERFSVRTPSTRNLTRFLAGWRAIEGQQGLERRLAALLATLRTMRRLDQASILPPNSATPNPLNAGRLAIILADLAPKLSDMRRDGGEINVWRLAGLKRAEVRNAAVLAAMWSPGVMGDRAVAFLNGFLRCLPSDRKLPSGDELARGYVVRTEHCATGAITERVDITVEGGSFVLAVEVKIDAGEGREQLVRYRQSVQDWARTRGKRGTVILLAPFQTPVPGIVQADWRDVVAAARAILPRQRLAFTHSDRLLDDFARHAIAFQGPKK